jgi:AraC family transcriptional regulator
MDHLIPPDLIPQWIPGKKTIDSSHLEWKGITLKGYQYGPQKAHIPNMRDYMIVVYQGEQSTMRRSAGGAWQTATVKRGQVSLLTRAEQSVWQWDRPINVKHIYISHKAISDAATRVFDREPSSIDIDDQLCSVDTVFTQCLEVLEHELANGGLGQMLLIDAMRTQIAVHLLRQFAKVKLQIPNSSNFSARQKDRILELIEDSLSENLTLESLADTVGMSQFHFLRQFKMQFGLTPHAFVIQKRIERAKEMLRQDNVAMKAIALDCGFSDQSHFCRTFHRLVGVTPTKFRRSN